MPDALEQLRAMLREIFQAQEDGRKAFPYRVQLTDAGGPLLGGGGPAAYNSYNGFNTNSRTVTPLSQREASAHMQTYGGSNAIDWLMDAISFTAGAIADADYHFEDSGKQLEVVKKPSDPPSVKLAPEMLLRLFEEPNPHMDWQELCELTLTDWFLVGNGYWVKWKQNAQGQPLALYRMAPQYVKIIPGRFGPAGYSYKLPGDRDDTVFTPDKVLHFRRPNPNDPFYGIGVVKGGARALDMELALTKTMASYYDKQALPSGVVQSERRVPRDVFQKLKSQLRAFYGGADAAGSLMVLEAGLKYQTVSPTAADALFAEMGGWSRDRIFSMFNINKGLLGIQDMAGDPKLGDWQLLFDRKTAIPLANRFSRAVTRGLVKPGWGLKFAIDYEETQQPDQVLKRAQTMAAMPGIKVHEVREAAGLPPSTGDKEIDETVLNLPSPNMDASGQGGAADRNLMNEPGRPPKAENTLGFGTGNTNVPPAAKPSGGARVARGKKSIDEILQDLEELETKALAPADHVHIGKLGDPVVPPQDTLHPKRTADLDALVVDLASQLSDAAHSLERGLLDATEGKAEGTIYQRVKNSRAWTAFRDRLETLLEGAAQAGLSSANAHHGASGLDPAEMDYESLAREVVYRRNGGLNGVLKTLKDRVLKRVLSAQQKGDAQADIQDYIKEAIKTWQDGNAEAVALDTVTLSYNEGTLAVAEANGATHVLVSDGMDHDEPCIEANGQTWTITQARSNPQEHPRCRRAFVPMLAVG